MWGITPAGRQAWESEDAAIPSDYRKLLWMMDVQGDARAIHELLRAYPEQLVRDWLRELQSLGFIENSSRHAVDRTLPIEVSELARAAADRAAAILDASGSYLAENRLRPAKAKSREQTVILIVEDDPDQLALADLRVSMAGYQVRTAESVQGLVRALGDQGPPDLVLLDVELPDGNGFDVLAKMRRSRTYAKLPIVMLTAKREPADIATGLALGADGYVTKPYSKNIVVGVVSGVLES